MSDIRIRCPKCNWEPPKRSEWMCSCRTMWNTFDTRGRCPGCGKVWKITQCLSCDELSPHADWYEESEPAKEDKSEPWSIWFWKNKSKLPVTDADKEWVEHDLLWLSELLTPEVFRSLETITPDKQHFDRHFTGTEEDADFILQRVSTVMNIKPWEISLMFFSDQPTRFSEGITATPAEKLKGGWSGKNSDLVDKGFGHKEIWVEMSQLNDPAGLIATISIELAKYKLTSEYAIEDDVSTLGDLVSLVFGFGIFRANSYFKFAQWTGTSHQGWRMQRRGGLPEPIIAYTMAWLAHYRNEDISWRHFLNKTMKKYFEQCYESIAQNKDKIKWSLDSKI